MGDDEPADIGVCLDIDGTVYRQGSVFVETLVSLVARSDLLDPEGRAHLRDAVGTVGRFHGGSFTRWRWKQTLRVLDELRRWTGPETAGYTLDRLTSARERLGESSPGSDAPHDPDGRAAFRQRLLTHYGRAIAGQNEAVLSDHIEQLLRAAQPVDRRTEAALSELSDRGVELVLVTDMPTHVADAFAEAVLDAEVAAVTGTEFQMDPSGTFTGEYMTIDKGSVVEDLVSDREWGYTLAAGDTARDAAMAPHVDTFLAVEGHGGVRSATADLAGRKQIQYVTQEDRLGDVLINRCNID